MRITLVLSPVNETQLYSLTINGAETIPIYLAPDTSAHRATTHIGSRDIVLGNTNSWNLHFRWTDSIEWQIVLPNLPSAGVIKRGDEPIATVKLRWRTWELKPDRSLYPGSLFLKESGLFRCRGQFLDETGHELATYCCMSWAREVPIDVQEHAFEQIGPLISALSVLSQASNHLKGD